MLWKEIWDSHRGRITGIIGGIFLDFFMYGSVLGYVVLCTLGVHRLYVRQTKRFEAGFVHSLEEWGQWLGDRWRPFK